MPNMQNTSRAALRAQACQSARRFIARDGKVLFNLASIAGDPRAEKAIQRLIVLSSVPYARPEDLAPHVNDTAAWLGRMTKAQTDDTDVMSLMRRATEVLDQLDSVSRIIQSE